MLQYCAEAQLTLPWGMDGPRRSNAPKGPVKNTNVNAISLLGGVGAGQSQVYTILMSKS